MFRSRFPDTKTAPWENPTTPQLLPYRSAFRFLLHTVLNTGEDLLLHRLHLPQHCPGLLWLAVSQQSQSLRIGFIDRSDGQISRLYSFSLPMMRFTPSSTSTPRALNSFNNSMTHIPFLPPAPPGRGLCPPAEFPVVKML